MQRKASAVFDKGTAMTAIVDCHTHTNFSDGASSFEENVRAAVEAGCSVLYPPTT